MNLLSDVAIQYKDPILVWLGLGEHLGPVTIWSIIVRIFLAMLCAGVMGLERARRRHAAGLRTYMLVCIGSTIVMITNQYMYETFNTGDIARLAAQVISGIGFLGAGTILLTVRSQIKGLTTAAGLWVSACIGLTIGIGLYTVSIIGTACVLFVFGILPKIELILASNSKSISIHVELSSRQDLRKIIDYIRAKGGTITLVNYNPSYSNSGLSVYTINFESWNSKKERIIDEINTLDYVCYAEVIL